MFGQHKAPFTRLEVQTPKEPSLFDVDQSFSCFALLDTGSPITYVPIDILDELNIPSFGEPKEVSVVGGRSWFSPYIASVELAGELLSDIVVYGWEKEFVLVGRDVLASFHVCLDGKQNTFDFVQQEQA